MKVIDGAAVAALGYAAAVRAIREALSDGLDPAADPPRTTVPVSAGQLLLMPSESATAVGVKAVTVAPGNPARGLPRIEAAYLLFDADTLTLRAVLDGTALTTLRTPAVSVAAVRSVLPERPLRVAVFGSGPQALGHVAALAAVRPLADTAYLVRDPARTPLDALRLGSGRADDVLRRADVVVCATSARSPLFDSALLGDDVVVLAVGSHEPDARELDGALLGRAHVVVEDVDTALREAGDIVLAIAEGSLTPQRLVTLREVVTGGFDVEPDRPIVFKSVGMAWEDLVVARAVAGALP